MKKILVILLAITMLAGILTACNDTPAATTGEKPASTTAENNTPKPTEGNSTTAGETEPVDTTPIEEQLNFDLNDLDYSDREFFIYHWKTDNKEFDISEAAAPDPIDDALYMRNLRVEEGLGIILNFHAEDGANESTQNQFVSRLQNRLNDPETPVDLVASYSRTAPFVLVSGLLSDLYAYEEYLDLDKAWWPNNVREEHEIRGRIYYTSGDISTGLLTMMEIFFMNKSVLSGLGHDYDSIMKEIKNGKWTIDRFIELTTGVYQDLDTVSGKSAGDMFGLVGNAVTASDSLWMGMGNCLVEASDDVNQLFVISEALGGETAINYINKISAWWSTNDVCISEMNGIPSMKISEIQNVFNGSRALFLSSRVGYFDASMCDVDYTVIPAPKADEAQEKYLTNVGNPYSLYGICSATTDGELAAQGLQALGYYAYNFTTPAVFEVTFKGKIARDDYAVEMFDIIRSGIVFDIGRTIDRITSSMLPDLLSGTVKTGASWSSSFSATKKKIVNSSFASLAAKINLIIDIQ